MKRFAMLGLALACMGGAQAATDAGTPLAAIKDLGVLNGQALACGQKDMASWTRVLMLNHAPKTREYGEAFEAGTQESFQALSAGRAQCPSHTALNNGLEEVSERLRRLLPAQTGAQ